MQLQVTVAIPCHGQRHASNVLAYLTEPTVIVCTLAWVVIIHTVHLIVLLSLNIS